MVIAETFPDPGNGIILFSKLIVISLFVLGTIFFYQASRKFGGNLQRIAWYLVICGIFGILAGICRFLSDFTIGYRWLETAGTLVFALISLFVAYLILEKFTEIARIFGMGDD